MPLWFRVVHRANDTGGVCGGWGHAGIAGCLCRERPGAGQFGAPTWSLRAIPGRGEGGRARFRTAAYGCDSDIPQTTAKVTVVEVVVSTSLVFIHDFRDKLRTIDFLDCNIVDAPSWTAAAF